MKPEIPQAVCPNTTTRRLVIGCAEASGKTKTKQTLQDRNKAKNQHRIEGKKKKKKAGKKLGKKIQSTVIMLVVETQYPVSQIFTDAEHNT